jgi:hypothetical protein
MLKVLITQEKNTETVENSPSFQTPSENLTSQSKTLAEREREYAEARKRIMGQKK